MDNPLCGCSKRSGVFRRTRTDRVEHHECVRCSSILLPQESFIELTGIEGGLEPYLESDNQLSHEVLPFGVSNWERIIYDPDFETVCLSRRVFSRFMEAGSEDPFANLKLSQTKEPKQEPVVASKGTQEANVKFPDYVESVSRWDRFVVFLGFPIASRKPLYYRFAWFTWLLGLILVGLHVFLATDFGQFWFALQWVPAGESIVDHEILLDKEFYAFDASDPWKLNGATLPLHFFLHGDVAHLLGNLYFLILFGRAVENRLGLIRYLVLLGMGALVAVLLFWFVNAGGERLVWGASGGISALLAYYGFEFGKARIGYLPPIFSWAAFFWLPTFPAWALVLISAVYEIALALLLPNAGIAYEAHVAGAAFGLLYWFMATIGDA